MSSVASIQQRSSLCPSALAIKNKASETLHSCIDKARSLGIRMISPVIGHILGYGWQIGVIKFEEMPQYDVSLQGRTPLHWAATYDQPEIAQCLISANADVSVRDIRGMTPLHFAVKTRNLEMCRLLIQAGADPFADDDKEYSPIDLAKGDLGMIRILTGTEKIKAFDACKDIHDFFALLFPPDTENLPPSWEKLAKRFPQPDSLKYLEQKPSLTLEKFSRKKTVLKLKEMEKSPTNRGPLSIKWVCDQLKKTNHQFALAWGLAEEFQEISLRQKPDAYFTHRDGKRMHSFGTGAEYNPEKHQITINRDENYSEKIYSLFFETINALQRQDFHSVDSYAESGNLSREEYAFCTEFIELRSYNWTASNLSRPISHVLEIWHSSNEPAKAGLISHTENIRLDWDNSYGWAYLQKNPGRFQKRLEELSKTTATNLDLAGPK